MLLRRAGPNAALAKFFLLHGSLELVDDKFMRRLALATKTQVKRYKETRLGTKSVATLAVGLQMFATCLWPRFLPTVFEPNLLFGLGLWVSFFFLGKRK